MSRTIEGGPGHRGVRSSSAPPRSRPEPSRPSRPRDAQERVQRRRRGRLRLLLVLAALAVAAAIAVGQASVNDAVDRFVLPLRHEDVIRRQARDKDLDPALIAAVIYQESRFRDGQVSPAGARGAMQLLPDTARFIARRTGGARFEIRDLMAPRINIAYGSWYLDYLRDRYDGDETLALAAYNAGFTNVDRWVVDAGGAGAFDPNEDIPFTETRRYVAEVAERRGQYEDEYPRELGL